MAHIEARHLAVEFPLYQGSSRSLKKSILSRKSRGNIAQDASDRIVVRALNDLSFQIFDGQRVALLGFNGAGKTTLLRILGGIFEPTTGIVNVEGNVATLLESSLGLDLDSTGRENIILRGMYLDIHPAQMRKHVDEIVAFTELEAFIDMPVRTYSAGMGMRLAFATATCVQSEVLLMDEWIAAGDIHFIEKANKRLENSITAARIMVFATHSLELAAKWCNRAMFLEQGRIVNYGPVDEIIEQYTAAAQ